MDDLQHDPLDVVEKGCKTTIAAMSPTSAIIADVEMDDSSCAFDRSVNSKFSDLTSIFDPHELDAYRVHEQSCGRLDSPIDARVDVTIIEDDQEASYFFVVFKICSRL